MRRNRGRSCGRVSGSHDPMRALIQDAARRPIDIGVAPGMVSGCRSGGAGAMSTGRGSGIEGDWSPQEAPLARVTLANAEHDVLA